MPWLDQILRIPTGWYFDKNHNLVKDTKLRQLLESQEEEIKRCKINLGRYSTEEEYQKLMKEYDKTLLQLNSEDNERDWFSQN